MDPFIGEIRLFSGSYAPAGWSLCDGSLLNLQSYQALFTIIGTLYGGDGKTNFAVPDMRGLVPMGMGSGTGLTPRPFNTSGGTSNVTLDLGQLPNHDHTVSCLAAPTAPGTPTNAVWANGTPRTAQCYTSAGALDTPMNLLALGVTGNDSPHNNMQPYLCLFFIIALEGIYPVKQ